MCLEMTQYPDWPGWPGGRCAVIAEVGVNHGGDPALAWEMILAAHECGADFIKLQSYVMEDFFHPSLDYYEETASYALDLENQGELFERAKGRGIKLVTTPFDFASADLAASFEPALLKVASMDNDNLALLSHLAQKGIPLLVSLGMADLGEIQTVVELCAEKEAPLALLHCVSDYPSQPQDLNLAALSFLKKCFQVPVGLSDHSLGITSALAAASNGAVVIEKHFTTDPSLHEKYPGADNDISIDPKQLAELVKFCAELPAMIGRAPRPLTQNEIQGRRGMRRGLYAKRDIEPGEKLSLDNVAFLRPVEGISASCWIEVAGKQTVVGLKRLEPLCYKHLGM